MGWTGDFIPKNTEECPDGSDGKTDFVVGEFNCSCVGISPFGAACGPDKDLKDVPDDKFRDGYELTCLMGEKALESSTRSRPRKLARDGVSSRRAVAKFLRRPRAGIVL